MNTPTPPPRLVPDRPSDAAIAAAFHEFGDKSAMDSPTSSTGAYSWVLRRAREIDAAAPPAEAPAERGDNALLANRLELAASNIEAAIRRGSQSFNGWEASDIREAITELAAAAAAPAEEGEDCCAACKGSGEAMGLIGAHDPQDSYEATVTCPECDGTGVKP